MYCNNIYSQLQKEGGSQFHCYLCMLCGCSNLWTDFDYSFVCCLCSAYLVVCTLKFKENIVKIFDDKSGFTKFHPLCALEIIWWWKWRTLMSVRVFCNIFIYSLLGHVYEFVQIYEDLFTGSKWPLSVSSSSWKNIDIKTHK